MSRLLNTGGLPCEDWDMIKIRTIMGAASRRKDMHCYNYVGLSFHKLLGGKWVFVSFLGNTKQETQSDRHIVIIAWRSYKECAYLPKGLAISAKIDVYFNGTWFTYFISNIKK